ncbi:MAG: AMP-binding protein, partial [Acidiphilium sp. 21-68-69]
MTSTSYVQGPGDTPRLGITIGEALAETARRHPDREALVVRESGERFTYAAFDRAVDDVAAGLLALGLRRGDRIGIWSPNNAEWAILQFASARAGIILVTINPAYRTAELEYVLNDVQCRALVLARTFKSSDYVAMLGSIPPDRLPHLERRFVIGVPEARAADLPAGMAPFATIAAAATPASRATLATLRADLQFDDPINIQFTSGTTGAPKGATLSHHNILNNGYFVAHLYGVPTMFIAMLEHPGFEGFDLSSLRGGIMAGTSCPIEVMRRVMNRMHMPEITICYGMTETSPVSFQSATDDTPERRVATVGRIHPHLEVKVIDAEGRIVKRGERGELCTRGYSVMLGYWGNAAKTAEAIDAAGWMHTGDLGVIDEEGYCTIVGRSKDVVIRGGENIYPREVEEFLFTHPRIASVSVFGIADAKWGEVPCA